MKCVSFDRRHTLMFALILLAGIVVLLFVIAQAPSQKPKSLLDAASGTVSPIVTKSNALDTPLVLLAKETSSLPRATLSNDQDHDGNYDGMADPLLGLGGLVTLSFYMVLLMPLVGRLLLRLCEPFILADSDYYLALERPG